MTATPKKNLRQKMIEIYKELDHVEKAGKNAKQNYSFVRAADVMRPIRDVFAKWGIYAETNYELLGTYDIKTNSGGNMHTASVKAIIKLYDADSDETKTISGLGDGADSGDKGIFKAQTGATKNALRNGTLLPDEGDPNSGDPEADENVDVQTSGSYAHNASTTEIPDFQDSQRGPARGDQAPKAKKTESQYTTVPALPAEPVVTNMTPYPAETPQQFHAEVATEHGDAYEGPDDGALPTETELVDYRARFRKLTDQLSEKGKLNASKGLPAGRKLLVFLVSVTKASGPKNVTKLQWDDFFVRANAAVENPEVGLLGLTKLVNKANGLEEKK